MSDDKIEIIGQVEERDGGYDFEYVVTEHIRVTRIERGYNGWVRFVAETADGVECPGPWWNVNTGEIGRGER